MAPCVEKKILLSGAVHTYTCDLLRYSQGFGILKYVIDRDYQVGSALLRPGDITYALYWETRPYTLYTWHLQRSRTVLYYFNVADRISLSPNEFTWRDLVVDILVDENNSLQVLDQEEIPEAIPPDLLKYIHDAVALIKTAYPEIVRESKDLLSDLL